MKVWKKAFPIRTTDHYYCKNENAKICGLRRSSLIVKSKDFFKW